MKTINSMLNLSFIFLLVYVLSNSKPEPDVYREEIIHPPWLHQEQEKFNDCNPKSLLLVHNPLAEKRMKTTKTPW